MYGRAGRLQNRALPPHSWHVLPVCLHEFSPSAPASSQSPKICSYTGIGGGEWMDGWK